MLDEKEKSLTFLEFQELALSDASFAAKLKAMEGRLEAKNLKDREGMVANYTQDTYDQFTADTQAYNKLVDEFEFRWNGRIDEKTQRQKGGLALSATVEFSWMRDLFYRICEQRNRELKRSLQTQALQLAELQSSYDALALAFGNPASVVADLIKEIEVQDGNVKKLAAQQEKIMGQLKLKR